MLILFNLFAVYNKNIYMLLECKALVVCDNQLILNYINKFASLHAFNVCVCVNAFLCFEALCIIISDVFAINAIFCEYFALLSRLSS